MPVAVADVHKSRSTYAMLLLVAKILNDDANSPIANERDKKDRFFFFFVLDAFRPLPLNVNIDALSREIASIRRERGEGGG